MEEKSLKCAQVGRCGGCSWGSKTLKEQHQLKRNAVRALFPEAFIDFAPMDRVRDRADLVWEEGRLGLSGLTERTIVDLPACPMMSETLEKFFLRFREIRPPIRKGSVRLRVSSRGEKGVWLDFANADVKRLFDEPSYLRELNQEAYVEIGQRRKKLSWRADGRPQLTDPELKNWFDSYDGEGRPIPLYGPVGGFTQTGFKANAALVKAVGDAAALSGIHNWLELFSGNGNLSLALAARGHSVEAVELDPLAVLGLERTLQECPKLDVRVSRGDVYLKKESLPPWGGRGLLLDPPRAGLRQLLNDLADDGGPEAIIYVSCFTDVFVTDAERLIESGWRLRSLVGVDQFPHSPHTEWVALFQ